MDINNSLQRKEQFASLYQKYQNDLFAAKKISGFEIVQCTIPEEIYDFCLAMAQEKHKHTINHSQNMESRNEFVQLKNALTGILAETYVHFLLLRLTQIAPQHILQFDLERPSWEHPMLWVPKGTEYDIKVSMEAINNSIGLEVKSSEWLSVESFVNKCHLIGGHVNSISEKVDISDFYFQVLFSPKIQSLQYQSFSKMYIVGVASRDDLYINGHVGTLKANEDNAKKNEYERMAVFINNHFEDIQSLLNDEDELSKYLQKHKTEINEPLYIQIKNNQTHPPREACTYVEQQYTGLLFIRFLNKNGLSLQKLLDFQTE